MEVNCQESNGTKFRAKGPSETLVFDKEPFGLFHGVNIGQ